MEDYPNILPIATTAQISSESVAQRIVADFPKAATVGLQVSLFVTAVILAITFAKFFLTRNED
jgi:hypothetical protein